MSSKASFVHFVPCKVRFHVLLSFVSVNTSRPLRNPSLHRAHFSFSFRPLAETLSHLLWGKQRFGELISWQGYAALLHSDAASVLLPTPALERKKKSPGEEDRRKERQGGKKNKSTQPRWSNNKAKYKSWEVDVKTDLFVLLAIVEMRPAGLYLTSQWLPFQGIFRQQYH